jgi:hypothetical protein
VYETSKTTSCTYNTTRATDTTITTDHLTTIATATGTNIFERITASQAGTIFDTEVSSASDVGASYWDGSSWS